MPRAALFLLPITGLIALLVAAPAAVATPAGAPADESGDVTWAVAPANTDHGRDRTRFTYDVSPGARITDAFAVTNRSAKAITLRVYASDGITTSSGALDLLPADRLPTDLGSWVDLADPTVTLKPQQAATIPFSVVVPANATPGDHTGGVVASLVTNGASDRVALDRRLGSRMYLRVAGTLSPTLKVGDVDVDYDGTLNPGSPGTATVNWSVTNTGNVRLGGRQDVSVTGLFGALDADAKVADLPELLPGDTVKRSVRVSGVWPGVHLDATVRVRPVPGADAATVPVREATGEASTWALPWGQLLVLIVLAAGVAAAWWQHRRRQAAVDRAISTAVDEALVAAGRDSVA